MKKKAFIKPKIEIITNVIGRGNNTCTSSGKGDNNQCSASGSKK